MLVGRQEPSAVVQALTPLVDICMTQYIAAQRMPSAWNDTCRPGCTAESSMLHWLPDRGPPHIKNEKVRAHRCGLTSGSTEDIWLQHLLLLLAQLDLRVFPQPGLMRQALALCMGLQQPASLVSQTASIVVQSCSQGCFGQASCACS